MVFESNARHSVPGDLMFAYIYRTITVALLTLTTACSNVEHRDNSMKPVAAVQSTLVLAGDGWKDRSASIFLDDGRSLPINYGALDLLPRAAHTDRDSVEAEQRRRLEAGQFFTLDIVLRSQSDWLACYKNKCAAFSNVCPPISERKRGKRCQLPADFFASVEN